MVLEGHLKISKGLDFVHERHELRIVLGVEQVVFKHGKFTGIWESVVLTIFFLQKGVNLGCGEFVRITPLHLSDHRVAWLDALPLGLANEIPTDDVLSHRHGARRRRQRVEFEFPAFEGFCKGEQPSPPDDQLGYGVVLTGEFIQRHRFTILQAFEHGVGPH